MHPICESFDGNGILVRTLECSQSSTVEREVACIRDQFSSNGGYAPTSLWRSDLPVGTPAAEWGGGMACGFVLQARDPRQMSCAYPFDAWQSFPRQRHCMRSPTEQAKALLQARRGVCSSLKCNRSDAAPSAAPHDDCLRSWGRAAKLAASCCWRSLERMVEMQKAFLWLSQGEELCVRGTLLHNQVQLKWEPSDIVGVFYVHESQHRRAQLIMRLLRERSPAREEPALVQISSTLLTGSRLKRPAAIARRWAPDNQTWCRASAQPRQNRSINAAASD